MSNQELEIIQDEKTGQVSSVRLYGEELLDTERPCASELWVNGLPLALRPHIDSNAPGTPHLKGERWVDHFSGWGLVLSRRIGPRSGLKHPCVGIQTLVRREICDQTLPVPGPGGPPVEAPLYVDTFSLLNWNWKFWGEDTRMLFHSTHSNGPTDEFGHAGHEDDTPENVKKYLQNVWRRVYPGVMTIHGGLFYNAKSEHWLAITCRRPQVGYILNIENAGRGVGYDFTLHAPFGIGESLTLPEIKIYHGQTHEQMMQWLADYAAFYYEEPPAWVFKTLWGEGLAWNNRPTWTEQGQYWEERIATGELSGIGYSLVTNRPVMSGTTPLGYEPDPNHGPKSEFKAMCRRLADQGVPILIWMSHSGLAYRGGIDIDDDWFIRGIDGRVCAAWGSVDAPEIAHINPGHPGYIEYTKRWIRFYIQECGCKGIFFDCLGWAFPPDFTPRSFMRFPGDTNRMAVKFMEEAHACIKECDPEAIMLGEGTTLDAPVDVFSIHANPVRSSGALGPRDFMLSLNRYSSKKFAIDQGPRLAPSAGFVSMAEGEAWGRHNVYLTRLLHEHGNHIAFEALPGDLSVFDDLLFVPIFGHSHEPDKEAETDIALDVILPEKWNVASELREVITEERIIKSGGIFQQVLPGIYRIVSRG